MGLRRNKGYRRILRKSSEGLIHAPIVEPPIVESSSSLSDSYMSKWTCAHALPRDGSLAKSMCVGMLKLDLHESEE